jgi:hypothetical protein
MVMPSIGEWANPKRIKAMPWVPANDDGVMSSTVIEWCHRPLYLSQTHWKWGLGDDITPSSSAFFIGFGLSQNHWKWSLKALVVEDDDVEAINR